jgi:hypothetical protein
LVMTRRRPVRCGKSRPVVSAAGRGTVACALPANPVNEFPKADVVTVSRSLELALFMDRQARRLEAARLALPFWPLARLAQNEELERANSDTGGGEGLGQREMALTGKNRIMIYGPRMTAPMLSSSERLRARWWRSRFPGVRHQWSDISRSACPMDSSCQTPKIELPRRPLS